MQERTLETVRCSAMFGLAAKFCLANTLAPDVMGNCNNEEFRFQDLVHYPIGKPSGLTPAGVLCERMPGFRILLDTFERPEDFEEKLLP